MNKKYKVLIIAGGGVYGCVPAHFLAMLPKVQQTLEGVDLLAGCSIGGILAAAYAAGKDFEFIDKTFQARAKDCFKKRLVSVINPLAQPKYDNDSIDAVLEEMMGSATLGDVRRVYPKLDLVIPALNLTDDEYKVFDNINHLDDALPLAKIAGYTSAAPSYYGGREYQGRCIVDGGMIEVAPLLTATTALKGKRGVHFEDMDVLMIGTGHDIDEKPLTLDRYNGLCMLGIATEVVVPYVTLSNEMATRYWGANMGFNSFNYFNPCIIDGALDKVSAIPETVKQCDSYKEQFIEAWNKWRA